SKFLAQTRLHGERKKTCARGNATVLNDHGTVVQRHGGIENGHKQIVRKRGIQGDAAFDVGLESDVPLDNDESASLIARKSRDRQHDLIVKLVPIDTRETSK